MAHNASSPRGFNTPTPKRYAVLILCTSLVICSIFHTTTSPDRSEKTMYIINPYKCNTCIMNDGYWLISKHDACTHRKEIRFCTREQAHVTKCETVHQSDSRHFASVDCSRTNMSFQYRNANTTLVSWSI